MAEPPVPVAPGETFTFDQLSPRAPRRRRGRTGLVVGVVIAVVGLVALTAAIAYVAGRSRDDTTPTAAATSTAPTARPRNEVECVNVARAFNAWDGRAPATASDVLAYDEVTIQMRMDGGRSFLDDVRGYDDHPSKSLAVAVADYNVSLSLVNLQISMVGHTDVERSQEVALKAAGVRTSYQQFKAATCT